MVGNYGLLSREEQLSDKSEVMSIQSETPARIEDIFDWIDGIPLSKTTKNLARDFSDAVLMAEILKFYYPHLVCPHNYIPANSVQNKTENWNTLNRKVLSKIDMRLSPETIDQLAHSQVGVIEKILVDFREKQMARNVKEHDCAETFQELEETNFDLPPVQLPTNERSILGRVYGAIKSFFVGLFGLVLTILCFWRWFSRKQPDQSIKIEPSNYDEPEERLQDEADNRHELNSQMRHLIKNLCQRMAVVEGTMKLTAMRIANLTGQLELRKRPRTQI